MIRHERVSFRYAGQPNPTLMEIDLTIESGQAVLLCGHSGCGKSTLLRTINGLIPHATSGHREGAVYLHGHSIDVMKLSELCSKVGTVFQNPSDQLTHSWVEDEAAFGLQNLGYPREEILPRIERSLREMGLEDCRHAPIHVLSGGQRQRLALASVMAMEPSILVLDEPTTQLDPLATQRFIDHLKELCAEKRLTLVLVDHRTDETLELLDDVLVMSEGRIAARTNWDAITQDLRMLADHGIEIPESIETAHRLGCKRAFRRESDLLAWCKSHPRNTHPLDWQPPDSRSSSEPLLELHDIAVRYNRRSPMAIRGVNLTIHRGELVALLGPNAGGKTTILKTMAGYLRPCQGRVEYRAARKGIQFAVLVPQDPDLTFVRESVWEEIAYALRWHQVPEAQIRVRLKEVLAWTHLESFTNSPPFALSHGQRQRTAVAAALALQPQLLLLDEPTTGQDRFHVHTLIENLRETMIADGCSVVIATHDLRLAIEFADRIIIVKDGTIAGDLPPRSLFDHPQLLQSAGHIPPFLVQTAWELNMPTLLTPMEWANYWLGTEQAAP